MSVLRADLRFFMYGIRDIPSMEQRNDSRADVMRTRGLTG
jgi:hypothetical protein